MPSSPKEYIGPWRGSVQYVNVWMYSGCDVVNMGVRLQSPNGHLSGSVSRLTSLVAQHALLCPTSLPCPRFPAELVSLSLLDYPIVNNILLA